jgi:hypothetical protein
MLNCLERRGVKRAWIEGIVCTDGAESEHLVPELARLLRKDDTIPVEDSVPVVIMDANLRELAEGPEAGVRLRGEIDAQQEKGVDVRARNVIIVDQAAHHLKTHTALRRVAEFHDANPLAFIVFVDRTQQTDEVASDLQEYEHFVPLYSWPCQPVLAGNCACGQLAELI